MQRDLEKHSFDKDEEWEHRIEKFHLLTEKIDLYEKSVSAEAKVSKLLWTLPQDLHR